MPDLTEERYIEIQFYYICADILKFRNNLMDLMDTIDGLSGFNAYPVEAIKQLAHEVITSNRYKPSKEELTLICHKNRVPIKHIKERTGYANKTIYGALERDNMNPRLFYPRFSPVKLEMIRKFVTFFNSFRKAGLE